MTKDLSLYELSIAQLLQRARARDKAALQELFRRCEPDLDKWARQRASSEKQGILRPSDIVQQGAMRAFERFLSFQGDTEDEWNGWLKKVLLSQAEQLLRESRREKGNLADSLPLEADEAQQVRELQQSPSQFTSRREEWRQVMIYLYQLPVLQREALRLRYKEELRVAEVARRLDKSEDAVASLLQRGLKTLKDRMAGREGSEEETPKAMATAFRDYLRRCEAGQAIDLESFISEYPDCADELRRMLHWGDRLKSLRPDRSSS